MTTTLADDVLSIRAPGGFSNAERMAWEDALTMVALFLKQEYAKELEAHAEFRRALLALRPGLSPTQWDDLWGLYMATREGRSWAAYQGGGSG